MKFTVDQIKGFYGNEARKHGTAGTSTIQDQRTRELELSALTERLVGSGPRILDVGCGNGWVANNIYLRLPHCRITGVDFSEEMLEQAAHYARPNLDFQCKDVLELDYEQEFDCVYSIRCLQNLQNWGDQCRALDNIIRALKPNGSYVMMEGFLSGLQNMNEARGELGLSPIDEPWHNNFFNDGSLINYLESRCELVEKDHFLSGYYFGSRVLLPALAKSTNVKSTSRLNDYFCCLPSAGDFCPMKLLRFRKCPV